MSMNVGSIATLFFSWILWFNATNVPPSTAAEKQVSQQGWRYGEAISDQAHPA